jgi:hypothetical protein
MKQSAVNLRQFGTVAAEHRGRHIHFGYDPKRCRATPLRRPGGSGYQGVIVHLHRLLASV